MAFRFAVTSPDGDIFETFESAVPNWDVGDTSQRRASLGPTLARRVMIRDDRGQMRR